jgi:L-malate glycosyltransferase
MKILFVFYIPSGGVETLNRMRCKALQAQGIECHLLYLKPGSGMQNRSEIPTFVLNNNEQIKLLFSNQKYDCIVVCSDYLILPSLRSLGFKGKMIYEVQGLGDKDYARHVLYDAKENVLSTCEGILYPKTRHLMEIIDECYTNFPRFCFHDIMDTVSFTYRPNPKPPAPIIGWVGRIEENKNWQEFLQIGMRFIRRNPAIKLWMFEDASLSEQEERQKFNTLIKQLGIEKNLVVRSNVKHENMADFYSMIGDSGGFLLSTSKVEGFGYAIAEAISCRCPVLSTDSDGVRTFIIHNKTGKFYKLSHIGQAVKEGNDLMTNIRLRKAIQTNAFNHLQSHCSPEQYVFHFKNMLKRLGFSI